MLEDLYFDGKPSNLLSTRQREVYWLIPLGKSNPQIAATLYIAPSTAQSHARNVLNKLGVNQRIQVAMLAALEADRQGKLDHLFPHDEDGQ